MKTEVRFLIKGSSNTQVEIINDRYEQAIRIIEMKYGRENVTILGYRSV